jgi:hypothetical protein
MVGGKSGHGAEEHKRGMGITKMRGWLVTAMGLCPGYYLPCQRPGQNSQGRLYVSPAAPGCPSIADMHHSHPLRMDPSSLLTSHLTPPRSHHHSHPLRMDPSSLLLIHPPCSHHCSHPPRSYHSNHPSWMDPSSLLTSQLTSSPLIPCGQLITFV